MTGALTMLWAYREEPSQRYRHPAFEVAVPTLNFGSIHGGDNPNRICGECELHFDLRAVPGMDNDELRAAIRAIVGYANRDLRARLDCACASADEYLEVAQLEPAMAALEKLIDKFCG